MAKLNKAAKKDPVFTHEGARATHINPYQQLRRSVCSCMLWEKEAYEDGESIADRIIRLCHEVNPEQVAILAIEARAKFKLRHVPLLLAWELARMRYKETAKVLNDIIQRPDELSEFLALYWSDGKCPLSAQVKKGLAAAFTKFNAYQLAKYNRDEAIKLRDVAFLCHVKPKDGVKGYTKKGRKDGLEAPYSEGSVLLNQLILGTLPIPETWEVLLSSGADKKATWEKLITEKKLGALAYLRNLRNMQDVGVDMRIIIDGLDKINVSRVLPFRFVAAAKYAPNLEPAIEKAMLKCTESMEKLRGKTALLVDHSGSMQQKLSDKSELTRFDAAGALGIILREICDDEFRLFVFSEDCVEVAPRRGFAMLDAVRYGMQPAWTKLGKAVNFVYSKFPDCERLIVITDEQSADRPCDPRGKGYVINVASARNGIGYGAWKHIDGFSEAVVSWIQEYEKVGE